MAAVQVGTSNNVPIAFPSSPLDSEMQLSQSQPPPTPPKEHKALPPQLPFNRGWTSPRKAPAPPPKSPLPDLPPKAQQPLQASSSSSTWTWKRPGDFSAEAAAALLPAFADNDVLASAPKTPGGAPQLPDFPFIQPRDESMGCLADRRREKGKGREEAPGILTSSPSVSTHRPTPSADSLFEFGSASMIRPFPATASSSRRPRIPAAYQHQAPSSPRLDAARHPTLTNGNAPRHAHTRFNSESAATSLASPMPMADKPPALPPPLIPAENDEMDVVMAAGRHSRRRNRSAGNLLDMQEQLSSATTSSNHTVSRTITPVTARSRTPASMASRLDLGPAGTGDAKQTSAVPDPAVPSDAAAAASESQPVISQPTTPNTPKSPGIPAVLPESKSSPKSWRSVPNFRFGSNGNLHSTPSWSRRQPISPALASPASVQGSIGDSPMHPIHRKAPGTFSQRARTWSRTRKQQADPNDDSSEGQFRCAQAGSFDRSQSRAALQSHSQSVDALASSRSLAFPTPERNPYDVHDMHDVTCTPSYAKTGIKNLWENTKHRLHASRSQPSLVEEEQRSDKDRSNAYNNPPLPTKSSMPSLGTYAGHQGQQPQQAHHKLSTSVSAPPLSRVATDYGRKRSKSLKGRFQPSSNKRDTYVFKADADESTLPPRTVHSPVPLVRQVVRRDERAWTPMAVLHNTNGSDAHTKAGDDSASILSREPETWQVNTTSTANSPYVGVAPFRSLVDASRGGDEEEEEEDNSYQYLAIDVGGVPQGDSPNTSASRSMTRSDSDLRSQYTSGVGRKADPHESLNLGELLAAHRMKRESSSYEQDVGRWRDLGVDGFSEDGKATRFSGSAGHRGRRISFAPSATSSNKKEGQSSFFYTGATRSEFPRSMSHGGVGDSPRSSISPATSKHTSATSGDMMSTPSCDGENGTWEHARPSSEFFSSSSVRRMRMSNSNGNGDAGVPMVPATPRSNILSLARSSTSGKDGGNTDGTEGDQGEGAGKASMGNESATDTSSTIKAGSSFLPRLDSDLTIKRLAELEAENARQAKDSAQGHQGTRNEQPTFKFPRPHLANGEVTPTSKAAPVTGGGAKPRVNGAHHHHASIPSISSQSSVGTTATRFGFPSFMERGSGSASASASASASGSADQSYQSITDRKLQQSPMTPSTATMPSSIATTPTSATSQATTPTSAAFTRHHKTSASTSSLGSNATSSRVYMNGPSWMASGRGAGVVAATPAGHSKAASLDAQSERNPGQTTPFHPYAYARRSATPQAEHATIRLSTDLGSVDGNGNSAETAAAGGNSGVAPVHPGHRRLKNSIDLLERGGMDTIDEQQRRSAIGAGASEGGEAGQFEDAVER